MRSPHHHRRTIPSPSSACPLPFVRQQTAFAPVGADGRTKLYNHERPTKLSLSVHLPAHPFSAPLSAPNTRWRRSSLESCQECPPIEVSGCPRLHSHRKSPSANRECGAGNLQCSSCDTFVRSCGSGSEASGGERRRWYRGVSHTGYSWSRARAVRCRALQECPLHDSLPFASCSRGTRS